jgi:hypothetical protein
MCRFFSKDFVLQACNRFSWRSRHVSLVRRSNGQNARAPTIQYWVFQEDRGQNPIAEWVSGANVTEMFLDYVPEKMTKGCQPILRQRRLGSGGNPQEPDFEGVAAGRMFRVGSGVLNLLGAFWDKLGGNPSAHDTSGGISPVSRRSS